MSQCYGSNPYTVLIRSRLCLFMINLLAQLGAVQRLYRVAAATSNELTRTRQLPRLANASQIQPGVDSDPACRYARK
ncbi:hypothetical protein BDV29DRAFT_173836 [Aspergillus leporis]|uniref:Uncharacterized protein n=1 Tax=Aspergillus leporis TaxID=41062 RepID=A0A5N5X0S9_9EURO|nr:hypothetical protein BDV29DRAFT_173836 [Aspergillus leporis]